MAQSMVKQRIIAVCGKGGVGKTAFTAMLTRALVESGRAGKLLLIDADPALGLPGTVGITVERTIGQVREAIIQTAKEGDARAKQEVAGMVDYMVQEALAETGTVALLAMGRTETMGCFCPVNNLLRDAIDILSKQFDTIVIDGEAGLEQINRQVMRRVDTLLVLSDSSARGLQTASVLKNMVEVEKVVQCERTGLVVNRVQGNEDALTASAARIGIELAGLIPQDPNITSFDLIGRALMELPADSPALSAVRQIVERYVLS